MALRNTANAMYYGCEAEAARERNGDDASYRPPSVSTSFTAINQRLTQSLSTTVPAQQNQARRRATSNARRRHNPAVAQYLGLGSANEPTHLEKYAPLPAVPDSPPPKPVRKRRRLADGENILRGTRKTADVKDPPNQRHVSESFRVKKPARKSGASRSKTSASDARPLSTRATDSHIINDNELLRDSHQAHAEQVYHSIFADDADSGTPQFNSPDTVSASPIEDLVDLPMFDLEADPNEPVHIDCSLPQPRSANPILKDDNFDIDIDIDDDDLLRLTSEVEVPYSDNLTNTPSSPVKSSTRVNDSQHQPPGSSANASILLGKAAATNSSQRSPKQFISPVTLTTKLLAATGDVGSGVHARKPIVRPPFPDAVRDRSPIIGLSSNSLLRTCFRIGEVINQSCQASKSGKSIIVELYARIFASERTDTEQLFTFCDLFHAKPPHIKAVYNATIWKSVQLFEYDSKRLLKQGRICRCIGTMKRVEKEWIMTVLNIWEATWEDIEWVKGIVNF